MLFFRSGKLLYSPELSCYFGGTPSFGRERSFLFSKLVSFLRLLPKRKDADLDLCIGYTVPGHSRTARFSRDLPK